MEEPILIYFNGDNDADLMTDEGEKVEELDDLQYEILPPPSNDSDYSATNGDQNAFSDFVSRHFMQRFSQLDLSRLFSIINSLLFHRVISM